MTSPPARAINTWLGLTLAVSMRLRPGQCHCLAWPSWICRTPEGWTWQMRVRSAPSAEQAKVGALVRNPDSLLPTSSTVSPTLNTSVASAKLTTMKRSRGVVPPPSLASPVGAAAATAAPAMVKMPPGTPGKSLTASSVTLAPCRVTQMAECGPLPVRV